MTSRARSSSVPTTMRSGCLKSLDRRALAQEFRIGDDTQCRRRAALSRMMRSTSSPVPTGTVDLVTTTVKPSSGGGDLARGGIDVGQIGVAVAATRRGADRDEHRVGRRHRLGESVVKDRRPWRALLRDEVVEPGLEDRNFAALQGSDLRRVLVDAGHLVAEIGKAGARHEPDIAGADHRDMHQAASPMPSNSSRHRARARGGSVFATRISP